MANVRGGGIRLGEQFYDPEELDLTQVNVASLPHLRYLVQERYVQID